MPVTGDPFGITCHRQGFYAIIVVEIIVVEIIVVEEIKCVVDHFGGFRAWIPERSDFFEGPKGPRGPLGPIVGAEVVANG